MEITKVMLCAARDAEFEHHQRNRGKHDRFKPLSDGLIRAIVDAAISAIGVEMSPSLSRQRMSRTRRLCPLPRRPLGS